jgi:hypothetical protein
LAPYEGLALATRKEILPGPVSKPFARREGGWRESHACTTTPLHGFLADAYTGG